MSNKTFMLLIIATICLAFVAAYGCHQCTQENIEAFKNGYSKQYDNRDNAVWQKP